MKINEQPYLIVAMSFGVITIGLSFPYIFNYVNGVTMAIFGGLTQLFLGINQINMAKKIDSKGINKGDKKLGIFFVFVGIFIFINVIVKMIIS